VTLVEESTALPDVPEEDSDVSVEAGERFEVLPSPDTSKEDDATSATSTLAHPPHMSSQTGIYIPFPISLTSVKACCPKLVAQQPR
jgi:hypothetical protein